MIEARLRTAQEMLGAGKAAQARATLERALQQAPASVEANALMSHALTHLGDGPRALYFARRAAELRPGDERLLNNLAGAQALNGDYDGAIATYRQALVVNPSHLSAKVGLTNALNTRHQYAEAEAICREGLAGHPGQMNLSMHLAVALLNTGRAREAVRIMRDLASRFPDDLMLASGLPHMMNYDGSLDPREVFEAHARFGRALAARLPTSLPPPPKPTDPDKRLRLGIVSADLRAHAVGFFAEPIIASLDRARFEVACYSNTVGEDHVSARIRPGVSLWRNVVPLSDEALARTIRADRIDILLDLSGHTAGHRLGTFHLRPAPVQATYFGYPNTTGVPAIDYRLVDSITDPREPWYDALATERLWRLDPLFLCYKPLPDAPPVAPPPSQVGAARGPGADAGASEAITFGSFNNLAKLDDAALALWAGVLRAVPGSRMLVKHHGLAQPEARALTAARLVSAGAPADRLVLEGPGSGAKEMLAAYARMDVMLDSFPYHGTTTTCEALYMGVPVVCLTGRCCAARVSTSILNAIGLRDLAADTAERYVEIASALAQDPARLASLRASLRDRFVNSSACDAPAFARRFEAALREMWTRACAGTGPRP
ncbi:MAG: tetratricopeptide repeat protein [Phycisphaerae bacterium]|nr:tetratricopeptide repeat protein [Phycisphaerae bacterium]